MQNNKLCCLIIMDGFGKPEDFSRSGIVKENTKNIGNYMERFPSTYLEASGEAVGLPKGQMGTSEVGHLTIGAGRVKYQAQLEIDRSIDDGSFYKNPVLIEAMENAKKEGRALHLLGIPTDGGIHSRIEHMFALLKMASEYNVKNVYIHCFTDGRDTPPKSALFYLDKINEAIKKYGCGEIATIIGRFYALDRDKNWDRCEKAYNAMVRGEGKLFGDPRKAIEEAYNASETDEFISPSVITKNGEPIGLIKSGDTVISYNYRTDREKQLAELFNKDSFLDFVDKTLDTHFVTMTEYNADFKHCKVAFPPIKLKNILSEVLSSRGYTQLKIAETEKYAHVTFFFNDGETREFAGEDRVLINSVKMKSYAGNPAMSAEEVANKTIEGIMSDKYNFITVNFANCDMVGHSGDIEAVKKAVQIVDDEVKRVVDTVLSKNGTVLLTADHGNADCMKLEDGTPCTAHTTALVPCVIIDNIPRDVKLKANASLANIAPTILKIFNESAPEEMVAEPLF